MVGLLAGGLGSFTTTVEETQSGATDLRRLFEIIGSPVKGEIDFKGAGYWDWTDFLN